MSRLSQSLKTVFRKPPPPGTFPAGAEVFLQRLRRRHRADYTVVAADEAMLECWDLKLLIQTREDLYIANEIFVEGHYDFQFRRDSVVIDVGMHTGFASLYFAAKPEVRKVFSFEPFLPTFGQALRNLELNPHFREKIEPQNFGLAAAENSLLLDYHREHRASTGIYGLNPFIEPSGPSEKQPLHLKNASSVLGPILQAHAAESLVLKIDCEGAEYEIFADLSRNGLLAKFSFVMCEWHLKGRKF